MNVLMSAFDENSVTPQRRNAVTLPWLARRGVDPAQAPTAYAAFTLWTRVHGLLTLEIEGCFDSMGLEATRLYDADPLLAGTGATPA
jgi:hypothetical protein